MPAYLTNGKYELRGTYLTGEHLFGECDFCCHAQVWGRLVRNTDLPRYEPAEFLCVDCGCDDRLDGGWALEPLP
jgi:hypothetical protein